MPVAFLFAILVWLGADALPGPPHPANAQIDESDLRWLAADEQTIYSPLPAFFRIEVRKSNPFIPKVGFVRYPRVSLNVFEQLHRSRFGAVSDHVKEVGATGESNISGPDDAQEVALAVSPTNPELVVAGANGSFGQIMFASTNAGATWARAVDLPLGGTCCDPAVGWSSDGVHAYASTMGGCLAGGCNVWVYRSDNRGISWDGLNNATPGDPRRELSVGSVGDKPFLHVDQSLSSPRRDHVYVAWHEGFELRVAVSGDRAESFAPAVRFPQEPSGLGADLATDSAGTLYVIWPTLGREIRAARSDDGGATFSASALVAATQAQISFPLPAAETRGAFVYASADVDLSGGLFADRVYVTWTDSSDKPRAQAELNHARVQLAYSADRGKTWQLRVPHTLEDAQTVDRWHPWLRVDERGYVHLVYYDSQHAVDRNGVDLYYQVSTDGGDHFSRARRLTSETSGNLSDDLEFGDYNALDIQRLVAVAGFTDSRREEPTFGDSPDVYSLSGVGGLGDRLFSNGFEPVP